ncbi:MAG: GyrI-like domain-containing protein [Agriterribacter sp.]
MEKIQVNEFIIAGLSLKTATTNTNGQSALDCQHLWETFKNAGYAENIPDKLGDEIYGVYYKYDGDSSKPFFYFVGVRINPGANINHPISTLRVPGGTYLKMTSKGKMPGCVTDTWKAIWKENYPRTYVVDFEVYDERSSNWNDAEVDVYLSIRNE